MRVAKREVERIGALAQPKAQLFFPWRQLIVSFIASPSAVQIHLYTTQCAWSVVIFFGLLANVGVFLLRGSVRVGANGGAGSTNTYGQSGGSISRD